MRCILVFGVVLAAVGGALALGSSSTPAGHRTTLVKEERLAGGAVRRVWSNGATFVGDADAAVTFSEDADGEATGATVAVPGPASPADAARKATTYRRAGRSPAKDMRLAGVPRPSASRDPVVPKPAARRRPVPFAARNYGTANSIYDSGCLTLDNSDAYWHGCFTRKGTASSDCCAYYLADSSQALGHAKAGGHWLGYGYTQQRYASGNSIVQWAPGSDVSSSSCTSTTIGLSGYGAMLSRTYSRCPKMIDVTLTSTKLNAMWVGCKGAGTSPGVAEAAFTRVPVGNSKTLYYSIGYWTQSLGC